MGAQVSTQVANQTTSIVNQSMTNMVTENISKTSAVTVNANQINLDLTGANIQDCDLDFSQMISAEGSVKCMAKFSSLADMKSQLSNALEARAAQASKEEQQALSLSLGVSTGISNINTAISNYVNTNITNKTLNEVNSHLANKNGIEIKAKGLTMKCSKGQGKFVINQGIVSKQTAELLSDAIIGNKFDSQMGSNAKTATEQKSEQKATGIQEIVSALGLTMMLPLIICVVVIAIFLLPGLLKSKGGALKMMKFGKRFRFGGRR